jgi:hypothetical protein
MCPRGNVDDVDECGMQKGTRLSGRGVTDTMSCPQGGMLRTTMVMDVS